MGSEHTSPVLPIQIVGCQLYDMLNLDSRFEWLHGIGWCRAHMRLNYLPEEKIYFIFSIFLPVLAVQEFLALEVSYAPSDSTWTNLIPHD